VDCTFVAHAALSVKSSVPARSALTGFDRALRAQAGFTLGQREPRGHPRCARIAGLAFTRAIEAGARSKAIPRWGIELPVGALIERRGAGQKWEVRRGEESIRRWVSHFHPSAFLFVEPERRD